MSFDLHEVDIETSDALLGEYGLRIPVVVIDGQEAFEYAVDPVELESTRGCGRDQARL